MLLFSDQALDLKCDRVIYIPLYVRGRLPSVPETGMSAEGDFVVRVKHIERRNLYNALPETAPHE
jgi:hypothetical protein